MKKIISTETLPRRISSQFLLIKKKKIEFHSKLGQFRKNL